MAHVNTQEKLLAFRRIWDREIRQELDQNLVLTTLTTLSTVLGNVVASPDEEKYRKLPATNKRLVETVLDRKGKAQKNMLSPKKGENLIYCVAVLRKRQLTGRTFGT